MADDVTAARGAVIQIESSTTDVWLDLTPHLDKLELDESDGTERKDAETWGDQGFKSTRVTGRGAKITLGFKVKRDTVTATMAPAQARVIELGQAQLTDAQTRVRFREHDDLTTWRVWACNLDAGKRGGATYDLNVGEATLYRCGAETTAAVV